VDELVRVVWAWRGQFADCSWNETQAESVSWIAWLRWLPFDATPRGYRRLANEVVQGEYVEAASAVCCAPTHTDMARWLKLMRNSASLARALEPLLDLMIASRKTA
jgi:PRTRC genetic system protein F